MRRPLIRGLGLALALWGAFLLFNLPSITGLIIVEDVGASARSIIGVILLVGGLILLVVSGHESEEGLATLVGSHSHELSTMEDHHVAHNAARHARLTESYRKQDAITREHNAGEEAISALRKQYGEPPEISEGKKWVTLYHATPRGGFRSNERFFIDPSKVSPKGFFMSDDPIKAQEEVPQHDPRDLAIVKIKIARRTYDELGIERQTSHINDVAYVIPKKNIGHANDLYKAGYIVLGRGR